MTPFVRPVGTKQLNVPITAPVLGSVSGRQFTSISPSVTSWKMQRLLLFVPRYNFNWQGVYRPVEPLRMPKGTCARSAI